MPAGGRTGPSLASWGRRAEAALLDIAIWGGLVTGWGLMLTVAGPLLTVAHWLGLDVALLIVRGYWLLTLGWWGWQWAVRGVTGQTVGQRLLHLWVLDAETGEPVGPVRSIVRSLTHVLDVAPGCLGLLRPTWSPDRQTWADRVHRTVVVHAAPTGPAPGAAGGRERPGPSRAYA